jgi:hypothetical protein
MAAHLPAEHETREPLSPYEPQQQPPPSPQPRQPSPQQPPPLNYIAPQQRYFAPQQGYAAPRDYSSIPIPPPVYLPQPTTLKWLPATNFYKPPKPAAPYKELSAGARAGIAVAVVVALSLTIGLTVGLSR